MRNTGGGRANNIRQVEFDNTTCDYLFIYTADEKMYFIPSFIIEAKNAICVGGKKYKEYLVQNNTFLEQIS